MDLGEGHKPSLERQLGLVKAISYICGGIIGVGIFIGPAIVLKGVGSSVGLSLTIWIVCGVLNFCGAMCYAEFGTRIPKSGGTYTYIREGFGDLAGFLFLWTQLVLVRPLAILLGALAASEYIVSPFFYGCFEKTPPSAKLIIGILILMSMLAVNCYSVNYAAYIQTSAALCKLLALFVIIISGLYYLSQGNVENFYDAWTPKENVTVGGIALTVYVCNYAYVGWDNVTTATEEITNHKRNIPLAILLGLIIVTVVYLSANVAYHAVLTNNEIMSEVAVAVAFGERILGSAKWIFLPFIGISAGGIVNTIFFTSSRINFIGGRDGLFPEFLSMVNIKWRTPMPSVIALGVTSAVYMCFQDFIGALGAYSFFRAAGEIVAICGIFRIRKRHPASDRTFITPTVFPVVFLLVSLCTVLTAFITEPSKFAPGLIVLLLGIPVFYISRTQWWKQGLAVQIHANITSVFQRLFLCDIATKVINEE